MLVRPRKGRGARPNKQEIAAQGERRENGRQKEQVNKRQREQRNSNLGSSYDEEGFNPMAGRSRQGNAQNI